MTDQPSPLIQFLPIAFIFAIFYFLVIRPQQQKQKEHDNMLKKLEKNDEVITAGGVHATVISVGDKTAMIRIAENVKVEVEKASISQVTKKKE